MPKALANFSLGLSLHRQPQDQVRKMYLPERVSSAANPFRVDKKFLLFPRGSRFAQTAGLKLANAFGVLQSVPLPAKSMVLNFPHGLA